MGGMLVVLFPWVVIGLAVVWFVIARVLRLASVGSLVAAVAFPVVVALLGYAWWEVLILAGLAALVPARHAGQPPPPVWWPRAPGHRPRRSGLTSGQLHSAQCR